MVLITKRNKTSLRSAVKFIIVRILRRVRLYIAVSTWYRRVFYKQDRRIETEIRQLKKELAVQKSGKTSWSDDSDGYVAVSRLAATNDDVFKIFKRSIDYREVVGHDSKEQGQLFLDIIKTEGKDLLQFLPKFRENDMYGYPITYNYEVGEFSPTTLGYVKILADLTNIFGDLSHFDIVEIGGGYGGQCKIISDVYHFKSYSIVDLDAILPLIQKYLTTLDVKNVIYESQYGINQEKEYDLLISNYAFSECVKSVQNQYIQGILSRSKRGYITYDFDGPSSENLPYNKEEIIQILSKKHAIHIADERPKTDVNFNIIWDDTII